MEKLNPLDWPRSTNDQTNYPTSAGLYALFLRDAMALSRVRPAAEGFLCVGMGQGLKGLAGRCHFRGKTAGHSPRRSLAALLADTLDLRPVFIRKPQGTTTFKLEPSSERRLDSWMEANLLVALHPLGDPGEHERELIMRLEPPLNCDKKVCPLNQQQLFILEQRAKFKSMAEQLSGSG